MKKNIQREKAGSIPRLAWGEDVHAQRRRRRDRPLDIAPQDERPWARRAACLVPAEQQRCDERGHF
jgi:hypothetical protein